jgi:protein phosphatase
MIVAHAVSETGRVRTVNEDSVLIDPDMQLYAVADGMGGHNAGEVASKLALEALAGFIRRSANDTDLSWPYGVMPDLTFQANRLRTALYLANRRVFRAAESHDDYTGMGTTVVSVLIGNERAVVAHVGDSRVYRLSRDGFTQITRDDSWAAALLAQGMTTDDLSRHPMRHVLTNVIGARDQVDVHVQEFPVAPGDRLLLCSDGLHEPLGDQRMASLLADALDARSAAATLVQTALDRGSRDNVTALVVAVEDGE